MTEVLTRQPLHNLSMSAVQNSGQPTRKAKQAFDEDEGDARPSKKARTDDPTTTTKSKPRARARAPLVDGKHRDAYEEEADGFSFARRKPKKTQKEDTSDPSDARRASGPRRKRDSVEVTGSADPSRPPRRRSARLSGDKTVQQQELPPSQERGRSTRRDSTKVVEKSLVPTGEIHMEKKRRDRKIALPPADTPVILRNKEMRKNSGQNRRRSSSTIRGQRASSLIDSGTSHALPHEEVEAAEFYKHISQDLSEPRRMRQLLMWCGTRALLSKPEESTDDASFIGIARSLQEELLKDFSEKSEMSNWFSRSQEEPKSSKAVKKVNPRNQQNAIKYQELQREVQRLETERSAWESVLKDLKWPKGEAQRGIDSYTAQTLPLPEYLADSKQRSILSNLEQRQKPDLVGSVRSRVQALTEPLELNIDRLADGVYKLSTYRGVVDTESDRIMRKAADLLQQREDETKAKSGTGRVGVADLLKTLSRLPR